MKDSIYLAIQYLKYNPFRTIILVVSVGIIIYLPIGLKRLISESEALMISRAESTDLIIGPVGSSTDLVINSLYFQQEKTELIPYKELAVLEKTGFGYPLPILTLFKARGYPIVGTSQDYFSYRKLEIANGRFMGFLGECVLGFKVAEALELGVGDSIISSSENLFELAGVYPLKMRIVGVLQEQDTPDDKAIFTDIKSNWVILGLGHGHQDLSATDDKTVILQKDSGMVTANAKLFMYNEITEKNRDSFHFHGNIDEYPLGSILFVPNDAKALTLLRGRFESGELYGQALVPKTVIANLLQKIFRIEAIFNTVFMLVGLATILIFALIIILTIRLRKAEMNTLYTIGAARLKIFQMILGEISVLLITSVLLAFTLYLATGFFVESFINKFIL